MSQERFEQAADLLLSARNDHRLLGDLPEDCRPRSETEGYATQDLLARRLGEATVGWKVACTSPEAQRRLETNEPFSGPMLRPGVHDSPATIASASFFMRMVEGEFAFRLGQDLPARDAPYELDEIRAAIATLHPAIEVADSRYRDWLVMDKPSLIADLAVSGALIVGPAIEDWQPRDLSRMAVRMTVNGETVGEGSGADALGDPVRSVRWLANHPVARGDGLRAGQIVTTGTCTGNFMAPDGSVASADFGDLGEVRITFSAA